MTENKNLFLSDNYSNLLYHFTIKYIFIQLKELKWLISNYQEFKTSKIIVYFSLQDVSLYILLFAKGDKNSEIIFAFKENLIILNRFKTNSLSFLVQISLF